MKICWSICAALLFAAGLTVVGAPAANATVCGSVGGARVDVSGCADPFYELNDALAAPPPPPPAPNVTVCVNAGRRINVSGCV
ncbi:RNA-binding protein [Mycobacterium sp.]|uniref:RNA-binding protein n=1 Tax=Mycobacterium sp. TaxID=1785 RepID=UPI002BE75DE5|nr:RNA-binding protein [Mycobacterium sp.]HKP41375.1 RNA-binding protein [Mycobacterium sp.]